jgi:hypothetical protein
MRGLRFAKPGAARTIQAAAGGEGSPDEASSTPGVLKSLSENRLGEGDSRFSDRL